MLKKVEDIRFKNYTYFESILVPENNGNNNNAVCNFNNRRKQIL